VQLATSLPSPQPLGTAVKLTASATDLQNGAIFFRFEIGASSSSQLTIVRDFSPATTFSYTPAIYEGSYQFKVTARNNQTLKTSTRTISPFQFTPLVSGLSPSVRPTAHPLVALFSAPSCANSSLMRVNFMQDGDSTPTYTSWRPCNPPVTMNFLVAGMRASSVYHMHSETWNGLFLSSGPALAFTTGAPTVSFPVITTPTPFTSQDSAADRFLLISNLPPSIPMAVDLSGNPVWYYADPTPGEVPTLTRLVSGGSILMVATGVGILREIDLAGNTIRETNAARLSEQVAAMSGISSSCQSGSLECLIGSVHHEAIRLPNGHTLVLADEEKIFTDGTQGSSPSHPVDIIGDTILDLDTNWQVVWYWRSFDHLDVNRAAVLGETCQTGIAGCPPVVLTTTANDWLHGNSIFYVNDGNIIFSMRHQDQAVKIAYHNGAGTGRIIWTLGLGGDFAINSSDPYPWFSHQHDVGYEQDGSTILSLFDNGNTRVAQNPTGHSRGYVLRVDERRMTVTPLLLADLGGYSFALGSAQQLANGNYHFLSGLLNPGTYNQSIEVLPNASIGYDLQMTGSYAYRSFRLANLYTPPVK
jgi:arylsulfate sulfotransferase